MRYLKVFSVLLVLGVFLCNIAQARQYKNFNIPFDKSQFSKILNEKFDSEELSVKDALSHYPGIGENRQEIIDTLWESLSVVREDIDNKEYYSGGVYLDNSINDYDITFRFDGDSINKIHVKSYLRD
jgi:hypothetical protein